MTIFWILLGMLMASATWFIYTKFHIAGKMSITRWILSVTSIVWGAFTLAWIVSSIAEGEMQAAGMGLLVFGFILLCLIILTIRFRSFNSKPSFSKKANTSAPV